MLGLGAGLSLALTGCLQPGGGFTPAPVVTHTPSPSAPSPSTSAPSPSPTATPTPSDRPGVKASGSLVFFKRNLVSDAFTGGCRTQGGAPTITLTDSRNDFYNTVELKVVLAADKAAVRSISGDFGEDSELIVRKLGYDGENPAKGTSAKVKLSGTTWTISGTAEMLEDGAAVDPIPFTIKARCADQDW